MNNTKVPSGAMLVFAVLKSAILFGLGYSMASKFMQGDIATAQFFGLLIIILKMR